jgi:hypothetical protein
MRGLTREPSFLLDCVRRFLQPDTPLALPPDLDWARLGALAREHAVAPLVYWTLHGCADALPPAVVEQFHQSFRETARVNLALSAELAKLLTLFAHAGIEVLPLKGPTLAQTLYGNLALRAFADLDLLIRPRDVLPAKKLLESNGYALTSRLHWPAESACFRARESQLSFADASGVSVDVHWRLLPDYVPEAFDEEQVWSGRRAVPLAGVTARTLSRERLLLFLCAHGAKHLWERLGWICDFARLLQVETEIDWPWVFAEASRTGTSRMLAVGLLLATGLLGAAPPPGASADPEARALAKAIRERYLDGAPIPVPALEAARLSLRMFERTSHRLRYVLGSFFGPSEAEYRALRLPPPLYGFYYVFRPLRLAARYARHVTGL